jgi:hypothetical protein
VLELERGDARGRRARECGGRPWPVRGGAAHGAPRSVAQRHDVAYCNRLRRTSCDTLLAVVSHTAVCLLPQGILEMQQALEAEEDAENPMDAAQRTYLTKLVQLSKKVYAKQEQPAKLLAGWLEEATALGDQLTAMAAGESIDEMLVGFMTMDPTMRSGGLQGMQAALEEEPNVRSACLRIDGCIPGTVGCLCPPVPADARAEAARHAMHASQDAMAFAVKVLKTIATTYDDA